MTPSSKEIEPVEIDFLRRVQAVLGELGFEAGGGLFAHFRLRRAAGFGDELRQDRIALFRPEGAAAGDLDRVLDRLGQVGELRRHLGRGLEAVLARQAAAVVEADEGAVGDAEQRIVRLVHVGLAEMHVIGRDQRQTPGIGDFDQPVFGSALFGKAVALQFDIETVAEDLGEASDHGVGGGGLALHQQLVDGPAGTAGERDQALRMFGKLRRLHMRKIAGLGLQEGGTEQLAQVAVAGGVLHQQRQRRRLLAHADGRGGRGRFQIDRHQAADDGLDAGLGQRVAQLIDAEEVVDVGDRDRGHGVVARQLRQLVRTHRAFEQRIGALHAQMYESRRFAIHVPIPVVPDERAASRPPREGQLRRSTGA